MALSDGRKSFQIGLAVLIQYRSVTDTHPPSQTRCRSYYALCYRVEPKMNYKFYNGHDELYHHGKFGEDRTMPAGCRCENVVFVTNRCREAPALLWPIVFTQ